MPLQGISDVLEIITKNEGGNDKFIFENCDFHVKCQGLVLNNIFFYI